MELSLTDVSTDYIPIRGLPTQVVKVGAIDKDKPLVLVIPGNPGVAQYYERFNQVLCSSSQNRVPVWCVSHAGHTSIPNTETINGNSEAFYSLEGQAEHKIAFIEDFVPRQTPLILIGHSIGCYIILQILPRLKAHNIVKCILLFPTVERMAESPQVLRYMRWCIPLPVFPLYWLPSWAKRRLLTYYFWDSDVHDSGYEATLNLFDSSVLRNAMNLGNQEMQQVHEANYAVIDAHIDKLMFYYGSNDHWCPVSYYEDMKKRYPTANIRLCNRGFHHAFVLEHSEPVAKVVWEWMMQMPEVQVLLT